MRLEAQLADSAARFADKAAIVTGSERLSYGDLDRLSSSLAAGLAALGVRPGDRVLLYLDNSLEAAIAVYAAAKAGAAFVLVNASTRPGKLALLIDDCRPAAILTRSRMAPALAEALAATQVRPPVIVSGPAPHGLADALSFDVLTQTPPVPVAHGAGMEALAMLIYTSGSTGQPKGVMMTHANVDAASRSVIGYLGNGESDVVLSVLPLAYSYGLYQLITMIRVGGTLVLEKSFAFPQAVFDTLRAERVTGLPIVPTMAAVIGNRLTLDTADFPHLRYITNAASALPPTHLDRLLALFPKADFYSMYGLTECKRAAFLAPNRIHDKSGSVGTAIPGTEAYVVDETGHRAAPGVVGEMVVVGPHVMQGYWNNPAATAEALRPDPQTGATRLHTGDLFYADGDGFLYFVGRKDDIIKTRGEKVAPREVEAVLSGHPGIDEALVLGLPDPVLGHVVCALLVRRDPALTERDVLAHCARHLDDFMVPGRIVFRDDLPRTDTGKLSRRLAAESLVR